LALSVGDLPITGCWLALAQDDNLTQGYREDAFAVARLEARGQASERPGPLISTPLQAAHAGEHALAPHRPRPITGPHQLHPGKNLLLLPAPSRTTARLALKRAC
jgi:hypothetical protein